MTRKTPEKTGKSAFLGRFCPDGLSCSSKLAGSNGPGTTRGTNHDGAGGSRDHSKDRSRGRSTSFRSKEPVRSREPVRSKGLHHSRSARSRRAGSSDGRTSGRHPPTRRKSPAHSKPCKSVQTSRISCHFLSKKLWAFSNTSRLRTPQTSAVNIRTTDGRAENRPTVAELAVSDIADYAKQASSRRRAIA